MKYNALLILLLTTTATSTLKGDSFFQFNEFFYGPKPSSHSDLCNKTDKEKAQLHVDAANKAHRIPLSAGFTSGFILGSSRNIRIVSAALGITLLTVLRSEKVKNDALTAASKDLGKYNRRSTDHEPTLYLEHGSFSRNTIKNMNKKK